jgi:glucose/arabinose dehydrogenase
VKLNEGMDERGITGFALHPQFKRNRKFYVAYNAPLRAGAPADWNTTMRVSEFQVAEHDAALALANSERILLNVDQPEWGHNSGRIAFGPDGFLYITVGDGGGPNDVGLRGHAPEGNGQHLRTLLGKILRIDVDKGSPYAIPADNPFADVKQALPEIYAYGLRNPWGLSFAPDTGELISTDIGQERWEEINVIVKGGNYGWRLKEGFDGFDLKDTRSAPAFVPKAGALGEPLINPVLVYKTKRGNQPDPEAFGVSVTGGYVYRGKAIPALRGK